MARCRDASGRAGSVRRDGPACGVVLRAVRHTRSSSCSCSSCSPAPAGHRPGQRVRPAAPRAQRRRSTHRCRRPTRSTASTRPSPSWRRSPGGGRPGGGGAVRRRPRPRDPGRRCRGAHRRPGRAARLARARAPRRARAAAGRCSASYDDLVSASRPGAGLHAARRIARRAGRARARAPRAGGGQRGRRRHGGRRVGERPASTARGVKVGIIDTGFKGYQGLLGSELPDAVTMWGEGSARRRGQCGGTTTRTAPRWPRSSTTSPRAPSSTWPVPRTHRRLRSRRRLDGADRA